MTSLEQLLRRSAGVVSSHELNAINLRENMIRQLLRNGTLRRVRHGWYACAHSDPLVTRAVSAGGVLTCVAALRRHGVWVPDHPQLLHARPGARGAQLTTGHTCRTFTPPPRATTSVDDVVTALRHAARCLDPEGFIVVCDSVLNLGLVTVDELTHVMTDAPDCIQELLLRCDGRAQSGTETMVRLRLQARNIKTTIQHHVPGVGYVDILVGNRLVIEVDSRAHHTGIERYEADRTRDRLLVQLGYLPIRFTYKQVVHDWAACEATVLDVIRRGEHRKSPRGQL